MDWKSKEIMSDLKIYKAHDGQWWADVSLKIYGTADYAFDLALLNYSSLTEEIKAGQSIHFDPYLKANKTLLIIYENHQTTPCTAFSMEDKQTFEKQEGISIWAINLDFQVVRD